MKTLVSDSQIRSIEQLEIQGLYPVKNSCQSFWTLKAKIELAVFQEKKEVNKHEENRKPV